MEGVPLWFGQQRGSGFSPYDIDFGEDGGGEEHRPADDVPHAVLGLAATLVPFIAAIAVLHANLIIAIPLILVGVAWLGIAGTALIRVASSEDFPAWAGVITYVLGLLGTGIKWTFLIVSLAVVVIFVLGLLGAMMGSDG